MSAKTPDSLEALKAGDEVIVEPHHEGPYMVTVSRTTPTQIVVGKARYRKEDGRQIGDRGFAATRLRIPTDRLRAEVATRLAREEAGSLLYEINEIRRTGGDIGPALPHLQAALAALKAVAS